MTACGLGNHTGLSGFDQFDTIQRHLAPAYRLRIVSTEAMLTVVRDGRTKHPEVEQAPCINLLLHKNHFDLIATMPGFYETAYFCDYCNVCRISLPKYLFLLSFSCLF